MPLDLLSREIILLKQHAQSLLQILQICVTVLNQMRDAESECLDAIILDVAVVFL